MSRHSYFFLLLIVPGLTIGWAGRSASALDPGHQRDLDKAKAELAKTPTDVSLHIRLQKLMLRDQFRSRRDVLADYVARLNDQGDTVENRFLIARLREGARRQSAFRAMIEAHPSSPWGYFGLAKVSTDRADYTSAERLLREALSRDVNVALFHMDLADSIGSQSKSRAALEVLDSAARLFPQDDNVATSRIWYLAAVGKVRQAIQQAEAVLKRDPLHSNALILLAIVHKNAKQFPPAIAVFGRYLKLWPSDEYGWTQLCWAQALHSGTGFGGRPRGEATLRDCTKAADVALRSWEPRYLLSLYWKNSPVRTAFYADQALTLKPPDHIAQQLRKNYGVAVGALSSESPRIKLKTPRQYVAARANLSASDKTGLRDHQSDAAWQRLEKLMSGPSRPALDSLIAAYPDFAPAYFNRGQFAVNNCCKWQPLDDLKKAARLAPDWARVHSALAAYAISRKDFALARASLQTALALDPGDIAATENAGIMAMYDDVIVAKTISELETKLREVTKSGQADFLDNVFGGFSKRLRRDPTSVRLHELYADIHAASAARKHWPVAIATYRKAIKLGGDKTLITAKIVALAEKLDKSKSD